MGKIKGKGKGRLVDLVVEELENHYLIVFLKKGHKNQGIQLKKLEWGRRH